MLSGCFMGLIYWVYSLLVILSDWRKTHGSLKGLELKKQRRIDKIVCERPFSTAPSRASQCRLYPGGFAMPNQLNPLRNASVHEALVHHTSRMAGLPLDPIFAPSILTTSEMMYAHFLVDSNTLK